MKSKESVSAQTRIPAKVQVVVQRRATKEMVSAASYYRRWIMEGYRKEFEGEKR